MAFSPSPGTNSSAPAPTLRWFVNQQLVATSSQWSGHQLLDQVPLDPPTVLRYVSASCPNCTYQAVCIYAAKLQVQLFRLWPAIPLLVQQDVRLVWCANLHSAVWSFYLSCTSATPSSTNRSSDSLAIVPNASLPADKVIPCSSQYLYEVRVRYSRTGNYSCRLDTVGEHAQSLTIFRIQSGMTHLLSAQTATLPRERTLVVSWHLSAGTGGISYQLSARPVASSSWNLTYHPKVIAAQLCPCTWPHSSQCVAQLLFLLDQPAGFRNSTATITLKDGALHFAHSDTRIMLAPDPNIPGTVFYYISADNRLYYSRKNSLSGNHSHFVFIRASEISHLLLIDYNTSGKYRFTIQLYLNPSGAIYRSLKNLNVRLSLFNSGPTTLGDQANVVWFIPLQHPALQCAWRFILTVGANVSSYGYDQMVKDAQCYIPDVKLSFDPKQYQGYLVKMTCSAPGDKHISIEARVGSYTAPTDSVLFCSLTPCKLPLPTIQTPPPPKTIIQTTRGTALILYGNAGLRCDSTESVTISWEVYSLTGKDSEPDWAHSILLPPSVGTDTATLHIPRFTLDYGFYRFILNVTLFSSDPNLPRINNSAQVTVEVTKSTLVALIAGGSYRTVGLEDTITLNASLSTDPDSPQPHLGLNFSWYCTTKFSDYDTMTLSHNNYCRVSKPELKWNSAVSQTLVIPPHTLVLNKSFYFRMVVQKDTRTSYFDQTITVLSHIVPKTLIICIENCQRFLLPNERFILAGVCSNCPDSSQMTFQWKLRIRSSGSEVMFDWASNSLTGNSMSYVSLNPLSFIHLIDEWYTFELNATTSTGSQSLNRYDFSVNSPPKDGRCVITPKYGWARHTKFTLSCMKFMDKDKPFRYKVIAKTYYPTGYIDSLKNSLLGSTVYFGYRPKSTSFYLPVGSIVGRHILIIAVQVFDSKGVYMTLYLKVRVYDIPIDPTKVSKVDKLYSFVEGKQAALTTLLHETDYLKANQLLYEVASMLNYGIFKDKDKVKVIKLRETLVNVSASIPVTSPDLIYQISASIYAAAQKEEQLSQHAQQVAAAKLLELSLIVLNYTKEAVILSESAELLSCSILTAASDVMAAFSFHFPPQVSVAGMTLNKEQQQVIADTFPTLRTLTEAVSHSKVPGQKDTIMTTSQWEITVKKVEKRNLEDSYLFDLNCANCFYPVLTRSVRSVRSVMGATQPVSSVVYKFEKNPVPWLGNASHIATDVTAFHMSTLDNNGIVYMDDAKQIEMLMVRNDIVSNQRIKLTKDPERTGVVVGQFRIVMGSISAQEVFFQLTADLNSVLTVSIYSGKVSADQLPARRYIIPHCDSGPTLKKGSHIPDPYIISIPTSLFQKNATDPKHGRYISIAIEARSPKPHAVINMGLEISVFTVNCLSFQGKSDNWDSFSCTAGPLTNSKKVHCICTHLYSNKTKRDLSLNFPWFLAASILVLPNVIDLYETGELIVTLPANPVTLIAVLIIFLIYFILLCWAWRKRKRDKKEIIILPDNDPCDAACYLVTLYTGGRPDAGTTADVFLTLVGMSSESDAYLLHHPEHQTFRRSSVDTFLITARIDLGELTFIRVWHNNVGPSPSWYLSRVKVQNVLTRQQWYFLCRKWLATMRSKSALLGTFPVTSADTLLRRQDVFFIEVSSRMDKEHLWFSVFALHVNQSFTRIQRLSCFLAMLLCGLLISIMLFQLNKQEAFWDNVGTTFKIAVESALVMVPVELLISGLFLYAQRKRESLLVKGNQEADNNSVGNLKLKSKLRERLNHWYSMDKPVSEVEESPKEAVDMPKDDHYSYLSYIAGEDHTQKTQKSSAKDNKNCIIPESMAEQITREEEAEGSAGRKNKAVKMDKPLAQPHPIRPARQKRMKDRFHQSSKSIHPRKKPNVLLSQCLLCLAWCIIWLVSIVSAVLIVLYGLKYGLQTSWIWLVSSVASFLQSIFLLQPLKIMAFAALFALSRRRTRDMDWSTGIEKLEISTDNLPRNDIDCLRLETPVRKQYRPLEGDELILAKKKGIIRNRALVFCTQMLLHLVFLGFLLYSALITDYSNGYYYSRIIRQEFSKNLERVNTVREFYTWMMITFLPLIHGDSNLSFLNGTNSVILGLPRMRQIRSRQRSVECFSKPNAVSIILDKFQCRPLFNTNQEDTKNYNGSWDVSIENVSVTGSLDYTGWLYEVNNSPWFYNTRGVYHDYSLGGYSIYFSSNNLQTSIARLLTLQNSNWIDKSTWVVVVETTMYNANVDLLCSISLILEKVPLGVMSKKLSVKSFSLRLFKRGEVNWILISILFMLFFIVFAIQEGKAMRQKGYTYLQKSENITSLIIVVLLLMTIILNLAKLLLVHRMLKFYKKNPASFIAFHVLSALDQLLRINVAFLLFVTIVKLLKYTQFLYHVRLAQKAISVGFPAIYSLALLMVMCSLFFMSLGHLLFGQYNKNFNTMIHAAQTIVSYYSGQFKDIDFVYSGVIGGIYLIIFVFIMNCILINLFQSVVILSYGDMKQFIYEKPAEEAEVAMFIIQECKRVWNVLWKKTPPEDSNEVLTTLFYGRGSKRTYGLKRKIFNRKKKQNYLFI
ncbi:polycystin family receptor for egg jelly-like [Hypanus sabinus]|uniref:polycystin family receptor for egg jelly-like n=1 Tax=Hypanus sabinus TaxID=79690 RepID=UPI0028C423EB|nr:polycystin family receptor for egg jelly-like [Hypanus sabinus]